MAFTNQPRKDSYLRIDGKVYYVTDRMLKTQGRQGGLIILKLKSLDSGNNSEITVKSGTKVEEIDTNTADVQYLYSDAENAFFMDMTTFETLPISLKMMGNYINFLKEGEKIMVLMCEGKVLDIKRQASVALKVTESVDAVKGNTANNATKLVTLETGYKVNVPMFIKEGDLLTINTESGAYTGRVSA